MANKATENPPLYLLECPKCGLIWRTEWREHDCPRCCNGFYATDTRNTWLAGNGRRYHPGPWPEK